MDDRLTIGLHPYNNAVPIPKKTIKEKISYILDFLFDFIHIFIISFTIIRDYIKDLRNINFKKNIGGQLALVTGGGNGLGREIALRLAKEGCNVIVLDIDGTAVKKTSEDIKKLNVKSQAYIVDVTKLDEIKKVSIEIEQSYGPVDILINNAGISLPSINLYKSNPEDIDKVIDVNVKSHLWTVRIFMENMVRRRKGHIVAINSICGLDAFTDIIYTTTKFALRGFMECLREMIRDEKLENNIFTSSVYLSFLNNRKEFVDKLNSLGWTSRIPPYPVDKAAEKIIDGILKNKEKIYIPWYSVIINMLKTCVPLKIKQVIIDTLLAKQ